VIFKDFFILSKYDKLCQEAAAETGQNALLLPGGGWPARKWKEIKERDGMPAGSAT